ncbi:hypothetical protein M011DRAFT_479274 [Sporormia fimetaria CBS 119925]|uniref:Uncharacterized protein n=1 Tax=Sporormia fimetaria CBS 119925 TaxID=1340428 RepID=A0A6A6V4Y2_9PLEO|nr:hypothetical protein M011DRAFT_479274 [Sporormia fimetaria CBS 119925]
MKLTPVLILALTGFITAVPTGTDDNTPVANVNKSNAIVPEPDKSPAAGDINVTEAGSCDGCNKYYKVCHAECARGSLPAAKACEIYCSCRIAGMLPSKSDKSCKSCGYECV